MPLKNKTNSKRKNSSKNTELSRFLKMQLYALLIYVIFFLFFSLMGLVTDLSKDNIYYVSLVVFCLAPLLVGFISGTKIRKNGLVVGVIYALPMNIIFLLISVIINGFQVDLRVVLTAAIMVAASAIGGVISVNIRVKK